MANPDHLAKLKEGVEAWNKWREENPAVKPDLDKADLGWEHLEGAHLERANLTEVNLEGAWLQFAHLERAVLIYADLSRADLRGANLEDANVMGVQFSRETLQGHDLKFKLENERGEFRPSFSIYLGEPKFRGIRVSTCHGSQAFKRFAQDQDYLEEFRFDGNTFGKVFFWFWYITCNCGRSLDLWALWTLFIAMWFGCIYYGLHDHFAYRTIAPNYPYIWTDSIVSFISLGNSNIYPVTMFGNIVTMCQTILGFLMLGGLISILSNKLARRA